MSVGVGAAMHQEIQGMLRTMTNAPVVVCGHSLLMEIVTAGLAQATKVRVMHYAGLCLGCITATTGYKFELA